LEKLPLALAEFQWGLVGHVPPLNVSISWHVPMYWHLGTMSSRKSSTSHVLPSSPHLATSYRARLMDRGVSTDILQGAPACSGFPSCSPCPACNAGQSPSSLSKLDGNRRRGACATVRPAQPHAPRPPPRVDHRRGAGSSEKVPQAHKALPGLHPHYRRRAR